MKDDDVGLLPPVRIMTFPARSDALLVYAPPGSVLQLPELRSPFIKDEVARACGKDGLHFRITDSTPGRWSASYVVLRQAEKAELRQRQNEAEAVRIAALQHEATVASDDAELLQQKAQLRAQKLQVDEEISQLKVELSKAKTAAFMHGEYLPRDVYSAKESRLIQLGRESQAIQVRLRDLRDQSRAALNERMRTKAEAFMAAAKKVLSKEAFAAIQEQAAWDV